MKTIQYLQALLISILLWMPASIAFIPRETAFSHRAPTRRLESVWQTTTAATTTSLQAMIPPDPGVEAEVCSTMAHLALDFTGFLSPSRSLLRIVSVIGRLFAISADYLPDHNIHPEELIIQIVLLSFALRGGRNE